MNSLITLFTKIVKVNVRFNFMNNLIENKRIKNMSIILLYVAFSVTGLLLLKIGTTRGFNLSIDAGIINFKISSILILGLVLYLLALLTSLIAMKSIDLSIFYPISAGLGYIFVCILSVIVLKEQITKEQFIGIILILIGVILMNLRR